MLTKQVALRRASVAAKKSGRDRIVFKDPAGHWHIATEEIFGAVFSYVDDWVLVKAGGDNGNHAES